MEIKKFFKKSNEITDISGDYVEIKMSKSAFLKIRAAITAARIWNDDRKWKPIDEAIDRAYEKGKAEWY